MRFPSAAIVIKRPDNERVRVVTRLAVALGSLFRELSAVRLFVADPTLVRGPHERPQPRLIRHMTRHAGDRLVGAGELVDFEVLLAPEGRRTESVLLMARPTAFVFAIELPLVGIRMTALARLLAPVVLRS